ncbi:MAG TPA: ATP-binding cassette domain-containing protein [Tepidisphaeraceae bacterium]|nr:ATP-binding cassette domain-containing protein [Tepidisphaeraceae bacterium]
MPAVDNIVIQATGLSKSFAGVPVVTNVSVDVRAGEVLALMGENGAGKSTVLKILAGVHKADAGTILVAGQPAELGTVQSAQRLGIALIHQEPLSFPDLTVAENIYLGSGALAGKLGLIDRKKIRTDAQNILTSLGVKLDPNAKTSGLSIADQQMVELAAALSQETRVLLMDEPTAALTPAEVKDLFRIVRRLKEQGTAIVFISHRLEEVMEISDRITVLRDGQFVATKPVAETSTADIISMMVGRPLADLFHKESAPQTGEPYLKVENLSSPGRFENISLEVHRGEIVGMAGLVGAGRTEVAETIFGLRPRTTGRILLGGKELSINSARDAIANGIAYVPEDRQKHGLLMPFSIQNNTTLASPSRVSKLGWLFRSAERAVANKYRELLRTRCRDVSQPVRELSGGNQQKVVLSKWLTTHPEVLILDEPTRGIDVGAKAEVHQVIGDLARQGKAILMISSDLPEVLGVSDRILVMKEGRLTGTFPRSEATQERVMTAATAASSDPRTADHGPRTSRSPSVLRFRELGILLFVLLAILISIAVDHSFASWTNFRSILLYIPLIAVMAMGQMMVIISRNIDLSVGSILGLSSIIIGFIFVNHPGFPLYAAALLSIGIGAALGLFNGVLVAYLRIPSIIATLGTLSAYRGLIFMYSGSKQVDTNFIPQRLIDLSNYPTPVPWIVLFAAFLSLATYLFLKYTRFGREVYAIGSNPSAALLRGIKVRRDLALIFTITGALSGLAGLMWASRFPTINPGSVGSGYELIVISAVIIGGTSVFGGSGSVLGVLLGCILIGTVNIALPALNISGFYQLAIYGLAILVAAAIDHFTQSRQKQGGH